MPRFDWQYLPYRNEYLVYDRKRGSARPDQAIAVCKSAYNAERIADALNKAEEA